MKKLLIFVMCVVFLSSCGVEPVNMNNDNPFIVGHISSKNGKFIYSEAKYENIIQIFAIGKPAITSDYELDIEIGDTLTIGVLNKKVTKKPQFYEYKDKNHKYLLVSFPECSECRITKGNNYSYTISVYSDAVSPALILETEQSIIPIEPIDGMRVVIKGIE